MLRAQLLSAAALGAALIALPALAQRDNGAIEEMRREQANPNTPWVPQQRRAAAEADAMGRQDASRWLAEADQALRRGRLGEANELLERAETRLLTRGTLAGLADRPMQDPVVDRIAEARRALTARDRSGALGAIGGAQTALSAMPRDDMAAGSGAGMAPAQGGGSWGGGAIHDRGTTGSTMSRATALGAPPRPASGVVRAQAGGGGGGGGGGNMGQQSGGLAGSTPGSPGAGSLGSTPQSTLGLGQQPAQGAAVPLVPDQGGRAAPLPGSGVQVPGGTGNMPGDTPRGAPMTGIR